MSRWMIAGLLLLLLISAYWQDQRRASSGPVFQKGFSYVAWKHDQFGSAASDQALRLLQATGSKWVALVVTWYQLDQHSTIIYRDPQQTPDDEGLLQVIRQIHKLGMKVMLRPLIDPANGAWRGQIGFERERDWQDWFRSYRYFIDYYAELARRAGVEQFCVGVEYAKTLGREEDWRRVIASVRARFGGPLVYSANWDDYQQVTFWNALDYVGIDAYFDLTDQAQPSPQALHTAWKRWVSTLEKFAREVKQPVLFTEIGLRSILGANRHPWDWNSNAPIDLREQADYYQVALETFWDKPWFYGFYWWAWLPYPQQGGRDDDGYSPHGKPAEAVLQDWYAKTAH